MKKESRNIKEMIWSIRTIIYVAAILFVLTETIFFGRILIDRYKGGCLIDRYKKGSEIPVGREMAFEKVFWPPDMIPHPNPPENPSDEGGWA